MVQEQTLPPPPLVRPVVPGVTSQHCCCPVGQALHFPAVQVSPLAQRLPQLPQLFGSLVTGMQAPLQAASPLGQSQLPWVQVAPVAQTVPQPPQLSGS